VVRSTVEETLNAILDAEAERLCRAERYERTEARKDTRAGSYERHLQKSRRSDAECAETAQPAI
jgi:putative transposase